ncbi:MAG: hypothetical protein RLZZ272_1415 [Actinomycetota bacterium]|jgi:hypothetical protein
MAVRVRHSLARWTVVVSATLLLGSVPRAPAEAAAVAATGGSVTATAAVWGAVIGAAGAPATTTPHTLVWTVSGNDARAFLALVNVGDLELTSQTIASTVTVTHGGGTPGPVTLTACVGADWAPATDSCAGTAVELGPISAAPLTTGLTIAPGARVSVRASTTRSTSARTDTVLDVLVARDDVRPATMTSG